MATTNRWIRRFASLALAALAVTVAVYAADPAPADQPTSMRRLTQEQYRSAIADIFGDDIQIAGRMDPIVRPPHGLQIMDVSRIAVSPAGGEEYDRMALAIAAQVVDEKHRSTLVVCKPRDAAQPDDDSTATFLLCTGRLLYRRPLPLPDVQKQVAAANEATKLTKNFYTGLQLSLASLMVSPKFLFDIDVLERDPAHPGKYRLDGFSKAARLSLFLWNT